MFVVLIIGVSKMTISSRFSGLFDNIFDFGPSKGSSKIPEAPPLPGVKISDGGGSGTSKLDQDFVDRKISHPAESSFGVRIENSIVNLRDPSAKPPGSMEKEINKVRKERQVKKDAQARDKLFGSSKPGKVDGKEVEPFSSRSLSEDSSFLVAADAAKKKKADPARNSTLLRTAVIAAPFSALGLVVAGTVNAYVKTKIDPAPTATGVTEQHIKNGRIVDQTEKDVFVAANALNDLRGDAQVAPDLKWAMKSDEERMDTLEEMTDYIEEQIGLEAQKLGVQFSAPATGAPGDDIERRAVAINSRLAFINGLFRSMTSKLTVSAE